MNTYFKSSRIAGLPVALTSACLISGLLVGCASTGQTSPTTPNTPLPAAYTPPSAVYDGYWAMAKPIGNSYGVVKFRQGETDNYRFTCHANGSYTQTSVETSQLVPTATGLGLKFKNEPVDSEIRVVQVAPKEAMVINQSFMSSTLKDAYPNGMNFAYVYTPVLKPLCP